MTVSYFPFEASLKGGPFFQFYWDIIDIHLYKFKVHNIMA